MKSLKAGAAKARITPPPEWFPIKIRYSDLSYTGVLQDIYTRAIVLDNGDCRFLFLNLDCGPSADVELKQEISKRFNIPIENMITCWTHNHSAPMKWTRTPKNEQEKDYTELVLDAIFTAIEKAISNLKPAKWGFAEGKSYINVNRDKLGEDGHWIQTSNFEGTSDKTLAAMKFVDADGNLIAAVLNYGCHATAGYQGIDFDGGVKVTGGFPGYTSEYLERRFPDSIVLWNSGAAGDQNPIMGPGWPMQYNDDGSTEMIEPPDGTRYIVQKYLGETHAIDALHTLNSIPDEDMKDSMNIRSTVSYVTMPGHHPPVGIDRVTAYMSVYPDYRRSHPEIMVDGKSLAELDRINMIDEGTSHMQMQLNIFDDVAWIGASGELYSDIGLELKSASPFNKTVIVTHTEGDAMFNGGYILSDASQDHDTFQFFHSETKPGGNDKRIVDNFLKMCEEIKN